MTHSMRNPQDQGSPQPRRSMSTTASDSRPAEDIPITTCVSGAKPEENRSARREDAAIAGDSEQQEYPSGPKFGLMVFALCLGGFLVSLDSTVVATAVPVISDEFHSLGDIGWYSSVYFLTMCMPQLPLVKVNDRYPIRWTYSVAMFVFLAGSAVCGAAPDSPALIAGRALAGLGSSGLLVGTNALVPFLAPAPERPVYFGLFAGAMGLGIGSGPLIGGVLTQNVTWRWNASHPRAPPYDTFASFLSANGFLYQFYMNLPIGAFIYSIFFLFVHPPAPAGLTNTRVPWRDFVQTLDLPGLVTLTPSIVCLQLALQWGGTTYQWHDGRILSLLILSGVLAIVFLVNEIWQGNNAMLPARIMKQRNVICAVLFCFCSNGSSTVLTYYLPIWFQGVHGDTPIQSGVHTLPLVITTVVTTILGGGLITVWGHVGPFMVIGSVFTAIGSGLLTTFEIATSTGKWIGYQLLYAVGSAAGRLCPSVCLQNILDPKDVSYGYTLITFISFIAGAIFVSVAQALFANFFIDGLRGLELPKSDITTSLAGGVKTITDGLTEDAKAAVLHTLNESIVHAWRLPIVLCCLGIIGALTINHSQVRGARAGKNAEK